MLLSSIVLYVQAICKLGCAAIHQLFIANPFVAKVLHFQGYDPKLLPMVAAQVPSMHVCLDFIPELLSHEQIEKKVSHRMQLLLIRRPDLWNAGCWGPCCSLPAAEDIDHCSRRHCKFDPMLGANSIRVAFKRLLRSVRRSDGGFATKPFTLLSRFVAVVSSAALIPSALRCLSSAFRRCTGRNFAGIRRAKQSLIRQ